MLSAVIGFLTSKVGGYLLVIVLFGIAVGMVHHDGAESQWKKDEPVITSQKARIGNMEAAAKAANDAHEQALKQLQQGQEAVAKTLQARIDYLQKHPKVVTQVKEKVIHDNQAAIDLRMPVVTYGFMWTRDLPLHPEYADVSAAASPAERAADVGVSASHLAQLDHDTLTNCVAIEFNLAQWQQWYQSNKPVFDAYAEAMKQVNAQLQQRWQP